MFTQDSIATEEIIILRKIRKINLAKSDESYRNLKSLIDQ